MRLSSGDEGWRQRRALHAVTTNDGVIVSCCRKKEEGRVAIAASMVDKELAEARKSYQTSDVKVDVNPMLQVRSNAQFH